MSKNKNTAVAVVNADIPNFIQVMEAKLKSITVEAESPYKTSGDLPGLINIKNETKIENLIKAGASVFGMKAAYDNYAKTTKLSKNYPAFNINGALAEDIDHDIKKRIAIVNSADEKAKIEADLEKAKSFLDKEEQRALFIAEKMAEYAK